MPNPCQVGTGQGDGPRAEPCRPSAGLPAGAAQALVSCSGFLCPVASSPSVPESEQGAAAILQNRGSDGSASWVAAPCLEQDLASCPTWAGRQHGVPMCLALSEGNGARLQLASWLLCPEKAPPHPPAACSLGTSFSQRNSPGSGSLFCLLSWPSFIHSFMTAFSQLDPLRCSCSPSPPLPCPWSSLVGCAPWEMGLWRWNSLLADPSPSPRAPHRLVLIFSLSFHSSPSEEPRWEDHLRRMFSPPKSSL